MYTKYIHKIYILNICSVDNSDIYWYIIQLPFSFLGHNNSEKAALLFLIFWDVSAQNHCDIVESSDTIVIEKYIIVS